MISTLSPEAVAQMVADLMHTDGPDGEMSMLYRGVIADAITTLAAENATLQHNNDIRSQNMRETWEAMQAMRNAINEHIQLPSLESDLLQGPENSVFCEVVTTAVIGTLATLRASEAAAMERITELEALLAASTHSLRLPE